MGLGAATAPATVTCSGLRTLAPGVSSGCDPDTCMHTCPSQPAVCSCCCEGHIQGLGIAGWLCITLACSSWVWIQGEVALPCPNPGDTDSVKHPGTCMYACLACAHMAAHTVAHQHTHL